MNRFFKIYQLIQELYTNIFKSTLVSNKKILLGIGGGGSNIVEYIDKSYPKEFETMIINSDKEALVSKDIENKLLLNTVDGYGCGSNENCGLLRTDAIVLKNIKKFIGNSNDVNIIVTLGGGVGSGSTKAIVKYLNEKRIKLNIFVVYPFSWEGSKRMNRAIETIKFIKNYNINLHEFYNDDLKEYGNIGMAKCFNILNKNIYLEINKKYLPNQT